MKNYLFLIFFSVVLTIYSLLHFYIYSRGIQAFAVGSQARTAFTWTFWLLAATYPLARIMERVWLSAVSDLLTWIGAFWLAAFLYFLLAVVFIDIIRLAGMIFPVHLLHGYDPAKVKLAVFVGVTGIIAVLLAAGHINAVSTRISAYSLNIAKPGPAGKTMRIVAVSDVHLGTLIGPRRLGRLIRLVNGQKPDLVLFAGDVVDEDLAPVIRYDLGKLLKQIKAPSGVYAVTGNHEYIGGAERAVKYLSDHGITILRDTSVLVADAVYIVGREDRDRSRFTDGTRKSLGQLTEGLDKTKPIIVLDHQPFNLEDVVNSGADLQISGHTHHGQLWPLGYITSAIFELSRGYLQKANTHFLVSTGFGTWGPPVRTGNRPEILVINLNFI